MTGLLVKRLQWTAHLYSLVTHHAQSKLLPKRGNLKFVRQSRDFKNKIKIVDTFLKTRKMGEKVALQRLLITANKMSISASNLTNELLFKELAITKSIQHWSVIGNINTYHVGNCCTILELILEKLKTAKRMIQLEDMDNKIKEAEDAFLKFSIQMANKTTTKVSNEEIHSLLIVHIMIINCLNMYSLKKCE